MAQTGYTPISLYYSTTASQAPTAGNLANGELAINITDGKLYYKDNAGAVQVLATKAAAQTTFQTSLGGLTPQTATSGAVTLAGTLNTTSGGTGLTTFTAGDLPYYASGTALSKLGIGTNGQILTSTGTAPQWTTLSGVAVTTFSAGTTGFTPSSATSGAVTLAGTLATTNGGTGLTSFTANGLVYATSTSALTTGSALTYVAETLTVNTGSTGGTTGFSASNTAALGYTALTLKNTGASGKTYEVGVGGNGTAGLYQNNLYIRDTSGNPTVAINSTGLGVFVSPSYALDAKASGAFNVARFAGQASSVSTYIYTDTAYWAFGDGTSYTGQLYGGHAINKTLSMYTDSVERVIIGATGTLTIVSGGLNLGSGGANGYISGGTWYGINSGDWNFQAGNASQNFVWKNSSGSNLARITSTGLLLVGTTSTFGGAGQFAIDQQGGGIPAIHLIGTQGVGGGARETGAVFSVVTNDTGPTYGNVAKISAAKENATQGNTAGYMAFQTTPNGGVLTERARFNSSGSFLINATASPGSGAKLLVSTESFPSTSEVNTEFRSGTTSPTSERYVLLSQTYTGAAFDSPMLAFRANANGSNQSAFGTIRTTSGGDIVFSNIGATNSAISAASERARIDTTGRFLVNTSSFLNSGAYLQALGGPYPIWSQGSDTGYTQGAIVCASGTADNPGGRGVGVYMWNQGTTATWYMGGAYSSADNWFVMRKTGSGFSPDASDVGLGWKMLLTPSGVAYQGNNSSTWSTLSDARVKDDVKTIENGLDVVLALRPVDFYNKVTKKREENFIAQEYEQVLANHVYREAPIGAEQEFVTDEILRLNPNLVPYLVSAIQKLSAEIEALKATRN